jgi:hypothetical protein
MQTTEMKGVERKLDDQNPGNAEFSGVEEEWRLPLRDKLVLLFLMFSCSIFESSVEREFRVSLPRRLGR